MRGHRVLVAPQEQSVTEYASGIVGIEDDAPAVMGTVVACGDVQDVKLDQVVLFPPEAGQEMEYEGQRYLVLDENELIAVWE